MPLEQSDSMDVYNPGFLAHENSPGSQHCRKTLLNNLLEKLRKSGTKCKHRHFLIHSLSGMGKTTLIREIDRFGREEQSKGLHWFPLAFPENHFEITRLEDIWLQALAVLADHLPASARLALNLKIAALPRENPDAALDLFLQSSKESKQLAVLLIDDIDHMLAKLESGHRRFFETLQTESAFRLVGTCAFHAQDTYLEQAVNDRLFEVIELDTLDDAESLDLLRQHAKDAHRPDILSELHSKTDRARALIALAGGNPRTLRLLFPLLAKENQEMPVGVLGEILDHISPWYKSRFLRLSGPAQRILNFLALEHETLDQPTIAEKSGEDTDRIRAVLDELTHRKLIDSSITRGSPQTTFGIHEKFFSVWCLMRNRERIYPAFAWLSYFLEVFYDSGEREIRAAKYLAIPPSDEIGMHYGLAFAHTIKKKPLALALQFSVLRTCSEHGRDLQRTNAIISEHCIDDKLAESIERMKNFEDHRRMISESETVKKITSPAFFEHLFGSPSFSVSEKRELAEIAKTIPPEKWHSLERLLIHESDQWRGLLKHHAWILYKALGTGLMSTLDDTEGAEIAGELWQDPVIPAISHDARLDCIERLAKNEIEKIETIYRVAIEFDEHLPILWHNLASLQHHHLGHFEDAESSLRRAIELDPNLALAWSSLGSLLKRLPSRLAEAESAYRKALKLEPFNPNSYNNLAWFLYQYRGNTEEASRLVHKGLELDPDHVQSFHTLGTLLVRERRWEDAIPCLRRFIEGCDARFNRDAWRDLLSLFREIKRADKYPEAISLLDDYSDRPVWKAIREILASDQSKRLQSIDELPREIRAEANDFLERLHGKSESA